MARKPHRPTRTCPHRWCRPLHMAPIPFFIALIAFDLWHNWRTLIVLAIGVPSGILLPKLIHYRRQHRTTPPTVRGIVDDIRTSPTALDLEMEDAKYAGTGWRTLHVRKGWARAAAACDATLLGLIGLAVASSFGNPAQAAADQADMRIDSGMILGVIIGTCFFGAVLWVHKKATQPRKPKRVTVPTGLQTNA